MDKETTDRVDRMIASPESALVDVMNTLDAFAAEAGGEKRFTPAELVGMGSTLAKAAAIMLNHGRVRSADCYGAEKVGYALGKIEDAMASAGRAAELSERIFEAMTTPPDPSGGPTDDRSGKMH